MRLTKALKETRELHTLYRKCSIVKTQGFPGYGTHDIGVCKVCGKAFTKAKFALRSSHCAWVEIPRVMAAKYIKQQRSLGRARAKVIQQHAAQVSELVRAVKKIQFQASVRARWQPKGSKIAWHKAATRSNIVAMQFQHSKAKDSIV